MGVAVFILMTGMTALARDYKVVVDNETIYFDLDRTRIAVGFAPTLTVGQQSTLLSAVPNLGLPEIRQVEEPLGMTLLNLKAGASEAELLEALAALESLPEVDWAGPVLIYDRQDHTPTRKIFIGFDPAISEAEVQTILAEHGLTLLKRCDDWAPGAVHAERTKSNGIATLDVCDALRASPAVRWADPDWIRTVRHGTTDTYYPSQWYLHQASDHDIDAPEAWGVTTGSASIVISICDVGVQIAHVDLNDKIVTGYDAVDGDSDPTPATTYDGDGHGTCCAGIAAAETNNSQGVAGVGYNCSLLGARLGYISYGGFGIYTSDSWIIACINYCRDHSDVMSNSWGGGSQSSAINNAFSTAKSAGLTILVASGNSNSSVQWPATLSTVIAVGATNENDYRCSPSDWGSGQGSNYGATLDVVAPGNNQYTTDDSRSGAGYSSTAYYAYFGGTSGACPVAAGVCGLILSVNPNLTPDEVQTILQNTANDLVGNPAEDVAGWDQYMGWGRVNAYQAVLAAGNVTVTSPNGGETWYTGESPNITWTSAGFSGNVKIELNRTYPGGAWETLYASTTNDGVQAWTVSGAVTSQARVRISSVNLPAISDESDANFTIASPFVTVTYPNGGETWYTGYSQTILWTSGGFAGNVNIDLSRNGGSSYESLYSNTPNDGTQDWTVAGTVTTQARIRIRSASNSAIRDSSDANFTIATPSITVISPNGGDIWYINGYENIQWSSAGITGNVKIELNRAYSGGAWEELFADTPDDGTEFWSVTGPSTGQARIRVSSVLQPGISDVSNADFSIAGQPPQMFHDPLGDFAPGAGTVTAIAYTPVFASVSTVKMFYRLVGAGSFDSLALSPTANPNEFAASLAAISIGSYEYYVKAVDNVSVSVTIPSGAPATLYTFDVDELCAAELAYDDGSAEYYSWSEGYDGVNFQWAVKFGPVLPPYVLCGARFAASRSLPDTAHSQVRVWIYEAGPGGAPGALIQEALTGSIGNQIGGVPEGTNWAEVILKDDLGDPLVISTSEFYIALGNEVAGKYEAFGRDDNGTLAHRSYFYDPCEEQWFSEDDIGLSDNAYPGNRLIRARGYSLVSPPEVVITRVGDDLVLYWSNVGAPSYNVYSSTTAGGTFTFLQNTIGTSLVVGQVGTAADSRFYEVRASSE